MGIDVYARFEGMTDEEIKEQFCGFDTRKGNVGYLREAYHGGPYATRELVPEAFAAEECEAAIPAAVMRERLPVVMATARLREAKLYKNAAPNHVAKAFRDFVVFCEQAEAKTGKPCTIIASY